MASNDYIYGKSYNFKYNDYITEMLANKMGLNLFVPPDAAQRNNVKTILKTSHYKNEGDSEVIKVDAYSYRAIEHVDRSLGCLPIGALIVPFSSTILPCTNARYVRLAECSFTCSAKPI